ncbi:protein FAR1-RELATED SEQUENCE 5-like [Prunus yedoensis var. nudiflora]|uniref:Protein FAR1-RELATED SEQUENCE 5-like n=1 Tax=Prunus yedoensis var. nudiflora TaxID=2094558 RepID=A0A314YJQ3_PRUYE|nr:protein FAR1-RELATED SEQUENCE 5-like [Prunus yedoensis var. nudiflora]
MGKGIDTSKGACTDSGYLGGCERLSHGAPSTESGHLSTEHPVSQTSDYNSVDIKVPRREDIIGK